MGRILAFLRFTLLVLSLTIVVFLGIVLKSLGLLHQNNAFVLRSYYCRFVMFLLGIRISTNKIPEHKEGVLYLCNHRSLMDALILFCYIRTGYIVSKAEVKDYPMIGSGASLSGVIYVDRADKSSRSATKNSIQEALRKKCSIILFPEGTVSVTRSVLDFKKGGIEAAIESQVEIFPIAMEYMNPKRDFWLTESLFKQFIITYSKWRTKVSLHFFEGINSDQVFDACAQIQTQVQGKLNEFQKQWLATDIPESLR